MDHYSASTPRMDLVDSSPDAKENQEPIDIRISAKSFVSTSKTFINEQKAKLSSPNDSNLRKHRRALHKIDNSCSRLEIHSPICLLPNHTSHVSKDPIEAKKTHGHVTTSKDASKAANKAEETLLQGHKRTATAVADDTKTLTDSTSQLELQESENLAWMDMMLALLEKRYDANSTLPVCVTDLEAANTFQLPHRKKIKTGIPSVQAAVDSKNSLDATKLSSSDSKLSVTKVEQISTLFIHEQEQTKEGKRQRLLLRHAQQIQASTVSSSTSCGCKTGCLKMYCMCFSSRGFCHAGCACDDCKNSRKNQTERVEAIQNYLANDPRAFSFSSLLQDGNTTGFLHLLPQKSSSVVMRGCRCKKSKCSKKYCECFQNGINCTSHCRCMDCSNKSEMSHLQKTPAHGKRGSTRTATPGLKPFHPVQITVTKQPRRNYVGKTLRLNL